MAGNDSFTVRFGSTLGCPNAMPSYYLSCCPTQRDVMTAARRRAGGLGAMLGGIVVASALTSTATFASTGYRVDNTNPSCSGTGPGTPAQPFCTITAAAKSGAGRETTFR
jgi:hypothetical protein